jgi:hypothetical protein
MSIKIIYNTSINNAAHAIQVNMNFDAFRTHPQQ